MNIKSINASFGVIGPYFCHRAGKRSSKKVYNISEICCDYLAIKTENNFSYSHFHGRLIESSHGIINEGLSQSVGNKDHWKLERALIRNDQRTVPTSHQMTALKMYV